MKRMAETITTVCKNCGREFTYTHTRGIKRSYCSEACQRNGTTKKSYQGNPSKLKSRNIPRVKWNVLIRYDCRCAICGWELSSEKNIFDAKGRSLLSRGNEIHHIVAVEDGGTSTEDNLILLCPNHHKQANAGILSEQALRKYWRPANDCDARENTCSETISNMIFGDEDE